MLYAHPNGTPSTPVQASDKRIDCDEEFEDSDDDEAGSIKRLTASGDGASIASNQRRNHSNRRHRSRERKSSERG